MAKLDLSRLSLPLLMGAMPLAIVGSFLVRDAALFERPELARVLFWHLPCPVVGSITLMIGTFLSWRAVQASPEERLRWDVRAQSAMEVGFLFSILTMVTGIFFSAAQWRAAWQWDPRQTSYLIVLFIYLAYFALRAAYTDADRRAQNAGAYALAAVLPMIFLTFVYPRLPPVQEASIHPTNTISEGLLKGDYRYVAIATVSLVALLARTVYLARVRAGQLELELGTLETRRDDAPPAHLVRPVRLPGAGG